MIEAKRTTNTNLKIKKCSFENGTLVSDGFDINLNDVIATYYEDGVLFDISVAAKDEEDITEAEELVLD